MPGRKTFSIIVIPGVLLLIAAAARAQQITGSGASGYIPKFTGGTTIGLSIIRQSNLSVSVLATPLPDWRFYSNSSSAVGGAIRGENTFNGYGVFGLSVGGVGVSGESSTNYGVFGKSTSATGVGVGAENNNSGGIAMFAVGAGFGLQGHSTNGTGVAGYSNSTGLRGEGGVNGVLGLSSTGNAAAFLGRVAIDAYGGNPGNLSVAGTLSKGAGSFKIDHPLDPENKYLYHSFVESPDMKNIYDGNIVTDEKGEAVVEMPDYFEALNSDFRYQLTVLGTFAQAIIAEEITGNHFKIRTSSPGVKVSWQVTGVRQDAFAKRNRIKVEVDKPDRERGLYLHPEAFNQFEERSVGARSIAR